VDIGSPYIELRLTTQSALGLDDGGASLALAGLGRAPGEGGREADGGTSTRGLVDGGTGTRGDASKEGLGAGLADLGRVGPRGGSSGPGEASSDGGRGSIGLICGSVGGLGGLAGAVLGGVLTGATPLAARGAERRGMTTGGLWRYNGANGPGAAWRVPLVSPASTVWCRVGLHRADEDQGHDHPWVSLSIQQQF
jgi:hypothetical protein